MFTWIIVSNLEQVDNLLYGQENSALECLRSFFFSSPNKNCPSKPNVAIERETDA